MKSESEDIKFEITTEKTNQPLQGAARAPWDEERLLVGSDSEQAIEYHRQIEIIEKAFIGWFYKKGKALTEIKEKKLYEVEFESWPDFCYRKLGYSTRQADRDIAAANIVDELLQENQMNLQVALSNGFLPINESQMRPLKRLKKPEDRKEAWSLAQKLAREKGQIITAEIVEEAAGKIAPRPEVSSRKNARQAQELDQLVSLPEDPEIDAADCAGQTEPTTEAHERPNPSYPQVLHALDNALQLSDPEDLRREVQRIVDQMRGIPPSQVSGASH